MIPLTFVLMPVTLVATPAAFVLMADEFAEIAAVLFETTPIVVAKVFSFVDTRLSREVTLSAKAAFDPSSSALILFKSLLIYSC